TEGGLMGGGRTAVGRALGPAYATLGLNATGYGDQSEETGRKQWAESFGGDAEVTFRGNQLMAGFVYTHLEKTGQRDRGVYVQAASRITRTLYGVLRVERLELPDVGSGNGGLIGLFWRPRPWLILKADYQFGDRLDDILEPGPIGSFTL